MKYLLLCLLVAFPGCCCASKKAIVSAIDASWTALKPYTVAGIQSATDIGPQTRDELLKEVEELSKTITHEVGHASE